MSSPHYCIWGLCESQQYCCGDNVCCDETDFNSLFLTAIIFGTIVILTLCCICCYCTSRRVHASFLKKYFKITYTLMSNQRENETNAARNQESIVEDCVVRIEKTKTML